LLGALGSSLSSSGAAAAESPTDRVVKSQLFARGSAVEAFRDGLHRLGYVEGENIIVEYRYAESKNERLP
jgi:hypothetical protein